MLTHWVNVKGQVENHPAKAILNDCWEHSKSNYSSFVGLATWKL